MSHRIVLATLNARYIHASLGLRYLLANMQRHGGQAVADCAVLREFTIQTPPAEIAAALISDCGPAESGDVHVIGLGIYIWNVNQSLAVVQALRALRPDIRIVLGGPEVSHELDTQPIAALADHVITGWGDVSFPKLCSALLFGPRPLMKSLPASSHRWTPLPCHTRTTAPPTWRSGFCTWKHRAAAPLNARSA